MQHFLLFRQQKTHKTDICLKISNDSPFLRQLIGSSARKQTINNGPGEYSEYLISNLLVGEEMSSLHVRKEKK